jgi:DNA-binding protein H-NS
MAAMSKSYAQIVKQIESLKQEAEKARRAEASGVIARIREAIAFYNLSAADLGLDGSKGAALPKVAGNRVARKAAKPFKVAPTPKFRDEAGRTWGGRGKRPQWLRDALAAGKSLSDFAIK